ncbi:phosphodiester glycosidase family protein [Clostridium saccharoperbutylacetonicum]
MATGSVKSTKDVKNNKIFKPLVVLVGILYIAAFLAITTPLLLLYGPYDNTRKVFISTLLGTRHAYLVNDFMSQEEINKILGVNNQKAEAPKEDTTSNSVTDLDKIKVKYTSGNEITRYDIHTDRYNGYVLEIKNPLGVKVAMTKYLGKIGQKTSEMAEDHNAIAAINGGAFVDESSDGTLYAGTGAEPGGFVISGGNLIYPKTNVKRNNVENVIAFTKGGQLIVGDHTLAELQKLNVQEAMCFRRPNIIINGKTQVKDKMADGLNPRTAVGQKEDGTVIFLVIDGRKITAPGASLYDVQQIMLQRGAINAGALDGGYSSTMYYKGDVINSPNAWDGERTVATAFYVD